jgi:hypothetical protein
MTTFMLLVAGCQMLSKFTFKRTPLFSMHYSMGALACELLAFTCTCEPAGFDHAQVVYGSVTT